MRWVCNTRGRVAAIDLRSLRRLPAPFKLLESDRGRDVRFCNGSPRRAPTVGGRREQAIGSLVRARERQLFSDPRRPRPARRMCRPPRIRCNADASGPPADRRKPGARSTARGARRPARTARHSRLVDCAEQRVESFFRRADLSGRRLGHPERVFLRRKPRVPLRRRRRVLDVGDVDVALRSASVRSVPRSSSSVRGIRTDLTPGLRAGRRAGRSSPRDTARSPG